MQDYDFSTDRHDIGAQFGGSYWYSKIENETAEKSGMRHAWALFGSLDYDQLSFSLTGGKNHVSNKDPVHPDYSVMGAFDGNYNVANKGYFYTADLSYTFKDVGHMGNLMPYLMYSSYIKDNKEFDGSYRNIAGLEFDHKHISVIAEYVFAKNDNGVGGNENSLAAGDNNRKNHLFNLLFVYNF
jgi:hypothetical protein